MNKSEYNEAFDAGFNFAVTEIMNVANQATIQARQTLKDLVLHLTAQKGAKVSTGPQIEDLQTQIKRLEITVRRLDRKVMKK